MTFLVDYRVFRQAGFSLVELMVGLVIGLLATLVIMQTFSAFEEQKRSTTGGADAQTNAGISLSQIQRDVQSAGFGLPLPMADKDNSSLKCAATSFDHDNDAGTPDLSLSPISIVNGAISDTVTVRYSNTGMGSVPVKITDAISPTATGLAVENNIGCSAGDVVLINQGSSCLMTRVAAVSNTPDRIVLDPATPEGAPVENMAKIACMGNWQEFTYEVVNNELLLNGEPIVAEVVNMQAQYGISATANSNNVVSWVDATAEWAVPTVDERNRIKAIRIAVVARNGLLEKEVVTAPCTTALGTVNNGPCAWDDTGLDPAPAIDLSADADWQRYRYKAYETVIPLRNMLWSKDAL